MSIQLAPEVEAGLRANAAALGVTVDDLIATAVKAYLRDGTGASSTRPRIPSSDRSAELAWAANPDAAFAGKWVVLQGSEIIASGSDPKQLYEEARKKGESSTFLIFVAREEDQPFADGWID
jgi:Family of unknown function (DUF5678)